jgi:hypothetical protein
MTRAVAVLLAAALALSLAAPAVALSTLGSATDAPPAALQNRTNTSNVLTLPETNRSGLGQSEVDLSAALETQWEGARARIDREALERRVREAGSDAARSEALRATLARLEDRLDAILARERESRQAYLAGELTTTAFLNRLGIIDSDAREVMETVSMVDRLSDEFDLRNGGDLANRILRLRARLALVTGPLRQAMAGGVLGTARPPIVYVGAADTGVTLASVSDEQFVHETVRFDNFAPVDPTTTSSAEEALNTWAEIYPTVWSPSRIDFTGLLGAYRVSLPFDGGRLVSYLDATTLSVYGEIQYKSLPGPSLEAPVVEQRDGMQVSVQRSYPGGPLRVVFESTTGTPRDGVIRVNGIAVGTSGADGTLWTITPSGQFTVTVDYGDRQLTVVLSASD